MTKDTKRTPCKLYKKIHSDLDTIWPEFKEKIASSVENVVFETIYAAEQKSKWFCVCLPRPKNNHIRYILKASKK